MKAFARIQVLGLFVLLAACGGEKNSAPKVTVQSSSAQVSIHTQLMNVIQNSEGIKADDRLQKAAALIEAGANVNGTNEFEEPILADAVHFGDGSSDDFRLVKLLVENGADLNKVGKTGRSPLTKAAESNKIEAIQYFLDHGLEVNTENGTRALVKAAFFGYKPIVELLLSRGLKPSGKYEKALLSMKSEETEATAALFGAYVDIAKEELLPLLHGNSARAPNRVLPDALANIAQACSQINGAGVIESNPLDLFRTHQECSVMGRLGSLAYMHCYGMLRSNSASLQMLQANIDAAANEARAGLKLENVRFAAITDAQELAAYDHAVRLSMEMYKDIILPWTRLVAGRMSHHQSRNQELRSQASACGNRPIMKGASDILGSVNMISADQMKQESGFRAELAVMDKMRGNIAYQLPALGATQELKRREERKRQEEEAKKKAAEEEKGRKQ